MQIKNLPCSNYFVKKDLVPTLNCLVNYQIIFMMNHFYFENNGYEDIIKGNYLLDERHVLRTCILKSFKINLIIY